jgi:hypothetical protein
MDTNIRGFRGERFASITVRELIELLQNEDEDALVMFTTDYGDYHHTPQALTLEGRVDSYEDARKVVFKSGYSNSGFEFRDPDERDDEDDEDGDEEEGEVHGVVVIR